MNTSRLLFLLLLLFLSPSILLSSEEGGSWEFGVVGSIFILPDETYLNPIFSADKNRLHLEARYNYEDLETGSGYVGYKFHAGESFDLNVIPMIGGVVGSSNGIAPAFRFEFTYGKLGVHSEGEYLFSFEDRESNFFYSWSELIYSPVEWFWFGAAGQRTRAFQSDLELQRGFLAGFGMGNFAVTGYVMNTGWGDTYGIVTVEYQF